MKIGYVIDDGLDSLDGVQQYVLTVGRWMESQGHEVHYLVGETKRQDIDNVHVMSKNLKVKFNANRLSTPLPTSITAVDGLLEKEKFDVLHVQIPYSPFMAARVMSRADKSTKIIGTFHILPYSWFQKICVYGLGLVLRRSARKFDRMLAVSNPAARLCRSSFGVKADVLPNAVDLQKFKPQSLKNNSGTIRIIFLGRLVERKGAHQLIKAIKYLRDNNLTEEQWYIEIGGTGKDKAALEYLIKIYGLKVKVKLCGFIDEDSKVKFLSSADIAIFPSLAGESFGIVLIEAMAAGAGVVLGGNNPGYSSVLSKECLFDPVDHEEIAIKLAEFINNDKLRAQIHEKQQTEIEKYDIDLVGKRLQDIYRGID
jgi:phosphatidyl-myo-inositol alpha-mannosyltransferase